MKKKLLPLVVLITACFGCTAQYNSLWIPDTLSGTTFNLSMEEGTTNFLGSFQTATEGFNPGTHGAFWGPTLFLQKGDTVQMNVTNNLMDSTTVHWHGMHLPGMMDGGPHQPIPAGASWHPYWKVDNNAATYWYHPHLHMMAEHQLDMGLGGFIIIRDTVEGALNLPRNYGVDDIPLALSDRRFTANQVVDAPYGDSMMVNGVLRPQYDVPSQVVRFRILDANVERSYNLGFSDNRTFYVITSDGGLLNAPVAVTRYLLSAGERIEILVNFAGQQGQSVDLKAYNSVLVQNEPGGDVFPSNSPFYNALARIDFNVLRLNVVAQTLSPVTSLPISLTSNTFYSVSSANITRNVTISDTMISGNQGVSFIINHHLFNINFVDYKVPLNNTEIWQVANSGNFSHPFHIHDVQFYLLTRNGATPPVYEQGWKDVVFVKAGETIKFITQFKDFADSLSPYMFHCHIALHEDEGMMGQFVVVDNPSFIKETESKKEVVSLYPVPANNEIIFSPTAESDIVKVTIYDAQGKRIADKIPVGSWINVAELSNGFYFISAQDRKGNLHHLKFIKN